MKRKDPGARATGRGTGLEASSAAGNDFAETVLGPDGLAIRGLALGLPFVGDLQAIGTHINDFRFFLARGVPTDPHEIGVGRMVIGGDGGGAASG